MPPLAPRWELLEREVREGRTMSARATQRMQEMPVERSREAAPPPAHPPPPIRHSTGRRPEVRQLFARDRRLPDDAPLVFIEIGGAGRLRDACAPGHLVCPVPGCPDPRLITRGGSRRDHFPHPPLVD